jgi:hypothetical protein
MNEQKERIPRIRDDSDTRALMLGSKACRELRLETQNVDWQKFLDEIGEHRRLGRNESEIDWKKVIGRCASRSPAGEKGFWPASLFELFSFKRLAAEVVGLAVAMILVLFVWFKAGETVSDLNGDFEALRQENETLKQEYSQLRIDLERSKDLGEQSQRRLADEQRVLEHRLIQLQAGRKALKTDIAKSSSRRGESIAIRDSSGLVMIGPDGSVLLPNSAKPPADLSVLVSELATGGTVRNTEPALAALETLRSGETRGALRAAQGQATPIPLSPLLSAVRSTSPTLRWKAVDGVEQYKITVAYPEQKENGKVIWQSGPMKETQVILPPGLLQRGEVYFWQAEALTEGKVGLSPAVGFWVVSESALSEIEGTERRYKEAELVLAAVYEANGLYEDALARVERLLEMNPTSPFVREMFQRLRRQLNRE